MNPDPIPSPAELAELLPGVRLIHVPPELVFDAAVRLIGDQTADPHAAAERFLDNAGAVGIDLGLMWATVSGGGPKGEPAITRQVALAVLGAGGTAMMFVSGPSRRAALRRGTDALGGPAVATSERAAVLRAACQGVSRGFAGKPAARLAQALLEAHEKDALAGFLAAGFTRVGDLAYLRRAGMQAPPWESFPPGVRLTSVAELRQSGLADPESDSMIASVLEDTYTHTLDCPELCGLRTSAEVLASHRAVGRFDPELWWIILDQGSPVGCALFNVVPELEAVELVYLGLAPSARRRGLGRVALSRGLRHLLGWTDAGSTEAARDRGRVLVGAGGVTCAVDTRNAPALRLYRSCGFQRFASRVPVVLGLSGPAAIEN